MNKAENANTEIGQVLALGKPKSTWKRRILWSLLVVVVAMGAAYWLKTSSGGQDSVRYKTAAVVKGNLVVTVSATGTLEPLNQVDVGTELSGTLRTVEVDFNDPVTEGQVLARLDTSKLDAQKLQYEAALAVTKADLSNNQAALTEAKVNLNRLKKTYQLSGGKLPSKQDIDSAEATYRKALAQVEVAKANIAKAQAAKDGNDSELAKALIKSPINGIVLDRQVEPGQTVAASYSTPVLFTLAEDLTHMNLLVAVDEADVGQVKEGQSAIFLVDAYPNEKFPAKITQVRFTPQDDDGVVTYECLLSVDNSQLLLRPGMTATADITVSQVQDAILVPNTALRFTPAQAVVATETSAEPKQSIISKLMPRRRRSGSSHKNNQEQETKQHASAKVWVLKDGQPLAIPVTAGVSDGIQTEIVEGELQPGQELLVDTVQAAK